MSNNNTMQFPRSTVSLVAVASTSPQSTICGSRTMRPRPVLKKFVEPFSLLVLVNTITNHFIVLGYYRFQSLRPIDIARSILVPSVFPAVSFSLLRSCFYLFEGGGRFHHDFLFFVTLRWHVSHPPSHNNDKKWGMAGEAFNSKP